MASMGRKRKHGHGLPRGVVINRGFYWLVRSETANGKTKQKWLKLAKEGETAAMYEQLAKLVDGDAAGTMKLLFAQYLREVMPAKAPKTRKEQEKQLERLVAVFGAAPKGSITSRDIRRYLAMSTAKVQARREIALLSHVHTMGIEWGELEANPCIGLTNEKRKDRKPFVPDPLHVMHAWLQADRLLRVAMAIGYVTGLRRGDMVKLRDADASGKGVTVTMNKTGKTILLDWTPNLRAVWRYATQQRVATPVRADERYLICDERGQPLSGNALRLRWRRLMQERPADQRFPFKSLRALSATDHETGQHLGHVDPRVLERHYKASPKRVRPI